MINVRSADAFYKEALKKGKDIEYGYSAGPNHSIDASTYKQEELSKPKYSKHTLVRMPLNSNLSLFRTNSKVP